MTTRHRHTGTGRRIVLLLALISAWAAIAPSFSYAAEQGEARAGVRSQESGVRSQKSGVRSQEATVRTFAGLTKFISATPWVDDPFATIGAKLETTAKNVAKIATPVAIICIVIVLVMYLFAPLLPDIAQQHKGYIIRALVIVAMIGFIPELVKAVAAFGGSS
jgi:hypothetical protein